MTLRAPFQMPTSEIPVLGAGGIFGKSWFVLLYKLYNAVTQGLPQPEEAITVGGSPFSYQAVIRSQVFVTGGTVSAIEYSRDGKTWYPAVSPVQMAASDFLRVTHTVAPTVTVVPM